MQRSDLWARARRLAIDVSPLRIRDFGLLWWGELVSETGSNITLVAVYIQVYRITGSTAAVGLVGLAQFLPLVLASLFGGPLVDRYDRRTLLVVSQVGQALGSGVLLAGALVPGAPVAVVYTGAGIVAGLSGLGIATRAAMIPNLVGASTLPSALALNQAMWNTALVVGPALGGVIVARFGLGWAYGADVLSYAATIGAALAMTSQRPARVEGGEPAGALAAIGEGFSYLRGRRVLQSTFVVDLVAMIFGMPRSLFPVLAVHQFHGDAEIVGVLFSAVSAGALVGALTAGWVGRIRHQGLAVLVAVACWGAGIVLFGLSGRNLALACVCLAVAGAADVISAVFRSTILQLSVPDELRGRLSSIHTLVVAGGPRLGDVEAGLVAAVSTPTISVVSGGLACLVGVATLGVLVPEFARYRAVGAGPPDPGAPPDAAADGRRGTLRGVDPTPRTR